LPDFIGTIIALSLVLESRPERPGRRRRRFAEGRRALIGVTFLTYLTRPFIRY